MIPSATARSAILGVPLDPNKQPSGSGVVRAFEQMDARIIANSAGALIRNSAASLNTISSPAAGAMAWVIGDATVANNGVYENTGTPSVPNWVRRGPLPFAYIHGINVGAGTANAIQITTALPIPTEDGAAEILVPIYETNTSTTVTLSINGETALPVKTQSGNNPSVGGLAGFMKVIKLNSQYRMMTDQASAAIQAAAEAAQVGAETAQAGAQEWANKTEDAPVSIAAGGDGSTTFSARHWSAKAEAFAAAASGVAPYATRSSAKAATFADGNVIVLTEPGREGVWQFDAADLSAIIVPQTVTTTAVDAGTETCTQVDHGLTTGMAVYPTTTVNGLTAETRYYAIVVDDDTFKLASSYANAKAGTAVNLTGTTNFTLNRLRDPDEGLYMIPDGLAIDGSQGALVRIFSGDVEVHWFGAKGDLSQDDAPYVQSAVIAAEGQTTHGRAGQYLIGSIIESRNIPINFVGDGHGAGAGSALQSNDYVTQFLLNYDNPSLFRYVGVAPPTLRDFQINVNPVYRTPGRGGRGIALEAPAGSTATLANARVEGVAFNWVANGLYMFKPNWPSVSNCYFDDWLSAAILCETETGVEGSGGFMTKLYLFGETDGSQGSCIHLKCGYTVIQNCEILGAQVGIRIEIDNYNAGYVRALDSTIEEQSIFGVYALVPPGTYTLDFLMVSRTEFAALFTGPTAAIYIPGATRSWLGVAQFYDCNSFYGSGGCNHFWIASGLDAHIARCRAQNYSGNSHTAFVTSDTSSAGLAVCVIEDCVEVGSFTGAAYGFMSTSVTRVRDHKPRPLGTLPAFAANGSLMMTTDAKTTSWAGLNFTATTGGPGGHVERIAGAWISHMP